MQKQVQKTKLTQKLSPQQIQLIRLLEYPAATLEERIREEVEENPTLEMGKETQEDRSLNEKTNEEIKDEFSQDENEDYINDDNNDEFENLDISEYVKEGDDETADYNENYEFYNNNEGEEKVGFQQKQEVSFFDFLMNQSNMLNLDEKERKIADFIIGSIDDDGYLRRDIESLKDDLHLKFNLNVSVESVKKVLNLIQEFEPAGIATYDLQECLLLQLKKKIISEADETKRLDIELAIKILEKYFPEFTKKHYSKILKGLSISEVELKKIIDIIIKLNPKPGSVFSSSVQTEQYIIPDFYVYNDNGELSIVLNSKNAPELRINSYYRELFKDYNKGTQKDKQHKDAVLFIKHKLDSAKWFIEAINQRQRTLELTIERIVSFQEDFFLTGDEATLKPMVLRDISERVGLDISTVSRVVNSKYVQTEYGTFLLKYFFSESMKTDTGDEVSTREVKKILSEFVESENKKQPYSDEKLMELLNEKGYNIARRTIAKYREQLDIPVARLRKQI